MAPFDMLGTYGKLAGYIVALIIGIGFGAVLEMSGFGDSRKLAAQFYLKEMTVLKVMFTAIIVAMALIFFGSAIGIIDFRNIYVNETFLAPQIVGGLLLGIGFIIGGFCPGTSVVAASTFKIDGMFFVGGVFFGVFVFGETFPLWQNFYEATAIGRFILPELLNANTGLVLIIVVLMALVMFWGGELAEKYFGQGKKLEKRDLVPSDNRKILAAALLVILVFITMLIGQPTVEDHWNRIKAKEMQKINQRDIYIHPGEMLDVMNDAMLYKKIIDVRSETDYNLFHHENAVHIALAKLKNNPVIKTLLAQPANSVIIIVANNELKSTEAYKLLRIYGVVNVYILEGGVNNWLQTFQVDKLIAQRIADKPSGDVLNYRFNSAVGESVIQSNPGLDSPIKLVYKRKVKIMKKKTMSGGCG